MTKSLSAAAAGLNGLDAFISQAHSPRMDRTSFDKNNGQNGKYVCLGSNCTYTPGIKHSACKNPFLDQY